MKDKKFFEIPLAIIIEFNIEDIMTASGGPNNEETEDIDWGTTI